MTERCLQEMTGSCGGCPIQEIVTRRVVVESQRLVAGQPCVDVVAIARDITQVYCPEGARIQAPVVSHSSIW